jgi:hypothetical protein
MHIVTWFEGRIHTMLHIKISDNNIFEIVFVFMKVEVINWHHGHLLMLDKLSNKLFKKNNDWKKTNSDYVGFVLMFFNIFCKSAKHLLKKHILHSKHVFLTF